MAGGVKRGRCFGLQFGGASMAGGAGVVSIRFVMTVWRQGAPLRSSVLGQRVPAAMLRNSRRYRRDGPARKPVMQQGGH